MKILVALHQVMDLGGIINHTEQLIGGLKDLGHEVDLRQLVWKDTVNGNNKSGDWNIGPSGIPSDQRGGWNFKAQERITYRGAMLNEAIRKLCKYDVILWAIPVPSKSMENLGNNDWPFLYDLPPNIKQVAFIHDGNAVRNYPYLYKIDPFLSGLACVHPCALSTSSFSIAPRALIVNPQWKPVRSQEEWGRKSTGFVNMQTFKAWKKADELVRAIAYMPTKEPDELREVAGEGIEYRYMTSVEKCKDQYFHSDPDQWFDGWKIWDAALGNDMTHHGVWNQDEVDHWLRRARVLVDPSRSDRYAMNGGHFNRVGVEAMIRGTVVVAREKGMGSDFFIPGVHYVAIPESADSQEYADIIQQVSHMPEKAAKSFINDANEMLPLFDRKRVAQQTIDLAFGNLSDVKVTPSDKIPEALIKKAADQLFDHFGIA